MKDRQVLVSDWKSLTQHLHFDMRCKANHSEFACWNPMVDPLPYITSAHWRYAILQVMPKHYIFRLSYYCIVFRLVWYLQLTTLYPPSCSSCCVSTNEVFAPLARQKACTISTSCSKCRMLCVQVDCLYYSCWRNKAQYVGCKGQNQQGYTYIRAVFSNYKYGSAVGSIHDIQAESKQDFADSWHSL